MEIYNKLLKCGIFKTSPKVKMNFEKKKAILDNETAAMLESGAALGKYLLVLKDALVISSASLCYLNRKEIIKT